MLAISRAAPTTDGHRRRAVTGNYCGPHSTTGASTRPKPSRSTTCSPRSPTPPRRTRTDRGRLRSPTPATNCARNYRPLTCQDPDDTLRRQTRRPARRVITPAGLHGRHQRLPVGRTRRNAFMEGPDQIGHRRRLRRPTSRRRPHRATTPSHDALVRVPDCTRVDVTVDVVISADALIGDKLDPWNPNASDRSARRSPATCAPAPTPAGDAWSPTRSPANSYMATIKYRIPDHILATPSKPATSPAGSLTATPAPNTSTATTSSPTPPARPA